MAEGGYDYDPIGENEDQELDRWLDHDDDDDEEEVDTTAPFKPGGTSTPYHGGEEQIEMHKLPREQSGLDETVPILAEGGRERAWNAIQSLYPDADAIELDAYFDPKSKRLMIKKSGVGKKAYSLYTKERLTGRARVNPNLSQEIRFALGQSAEEKIVQQRQETRETDQRLKEAQRLEKTLNETAAKQQQAAQEKQAKEDQLEQIYHHIANTENEGGTLIERQNEIDRLNREKAKIERDIEEAKKKSKEYAKTIIDREKATREVERLQRKLADEKQKTNTIEARLNSTKPLDELNEQESELVRQNEEDKRVIEDENTSPSDREAAEARVAEREEELARLRTQVQEREALPLRERVKNIFKKYGWTLQAVVLAAGLVIGAVTIAAMNGLKAGTKAIGNGLKALGNKVASILPGLIGSIVSFIFKTAGQVLSFLGEHAWLLILAVVGFMIERISKRRR